MMIVVMMMRMIVMMMRIIVMMMRMIVMIQSWLQFQKSWRAGLWNFTNLKKTFHRKVSSWVSVGSKRIEMRLWYRSEYWCHIHCVTVRINWRLIKNLQWPKMTTMTIVRNRPQLGSYKSSRRNEDVKVNVIEPEAE